MSGCRFFGTAAGSGNRSPPLLSAPLNFLLSAWLLTGLYLALAVRYDVLRSVSLLLLLPIRGGNVASLGSLAAMAWAAETSEK